MKTKVIKLIWFDFWFLVFTYNFNLIILHFNFVPFFLNLIFLIQYIVDSSNDPDFIIYILGDWDLKLGRYQFNASLDFKFIIHVLIIMRTASCSQKKGNRICHQGLFTMWNMIWAHKGEAEAWNHVKWGDGPPLLGEPHKTHNSAPKRMQKPTQMLRGPLQLQERVPNSNSPHGKA